MSLGRIIRFATVGGTGFVVDAGITEALVYLGLSPYLARVLAVAAAIAVTYALNRRFTFKTGASDARRGRERAAYLAVSLASIALNYAVYAAAIYLIPGLQPVIGVAFGSGVAMFTNYFGYSRLVFAPAGPGQAA
ncbi:GtrA family protein [Oryzibacter oryziterrae]|uniref:GtrA family protein n=1 Tax=Oryzibacter oryziterrae TaxID=2766474 RepID=UPI001F44DC28|nr:GtrA family protein [Oryzibacter oryziterrae]